jgi:hypothetical protein
MPTIYANGGSPNYGGVVFRNGEELLTLLKNNLSSAGWETISDQIASSLTLQMKGVDNGDNCFIKLTIENDQTETFGKKLVLQGDFAGNNVANDLSPKLDLNYIDTAANVFWLTANDGAACLAIRSVTGSVKSCHFGFLKRLNPSLDPCGWMVGYLHTLQQFSYFAQLTYSAQKWASVHSLINMSSTQPWTQALHTTGDRYTCCFSPINNNYTLSDVPWAASSFAHQGSMDFLTNLPIIVEDYYFLEGLGTIYNEAPRGWNAASQVPAQLTNRGWVQFAAVGLASISAAIFLRVITEDNKERRYLSGGPRQWAGFRIAEFESTP